MVRLGERERILPCAHLGSAKKKTSTGILLYSMTRERNVQKLGNLPSYNSLAGNPRVEVVSQKAIRRLAVRLARCFTMDCLMQFMYYWNQGVYSKNKPHALLTLHYSWMLPATPI